MYPLVYKYLLQYKKVSVPGIGNFSVTTLPATIDADTLYAPKNIIQFKPETAIADRIFYEFVAKELSINEVDAIKQYHEFAYQLKSDISHAEGVQFPGIGILKKQDSGSFIFEPEDSKLLFYPNIKLLQTNNNSNKQNKISNSFIEKNPSENIELTPVVVEETTKKDFWWLYALVLGIIGFAAIAYKHKWIQF